MIVFPRTLLASLLLMAGPAIAVDNQRTVKLDLSTEEHPINPFIYGQFIEHLGRCIYGGIWAEMLEDRKFYFPITPEFDPYRDLQETDFPVVGASPWEIVGDVSGVEMQPEGAFVGDHSPQIARGSGIRQGKLEFVKGASYVGYIWLKGMDTRAEVEVTLVTGGQRRSVYFQPDTDDFTRYGLRFDAEGESGLLEIRATGGSCLVGTVSLMPGDNVNGMRRDTLELLKELNAPMYRWPGGNFVSGYDWRDGIGDRDRRAPRKNPAWTGVEHNDFGTDEFIAFCRMVGAEPMIAANTGFGDAASAAQWVQYCNGKASTPAGAWRAENGQEEPFGVKYWCVGNEMFGTWQLGFMQLHHYTIKHNLVADAMKRVDRSLVLVGVGDLHGINRDHDPDQVKAGVTWSEGMLKACADHMDLISEHFYEGRVPWKEPDPRPSVEAHVGALRESIRDRAEGHRELQARLPELNGRIIPIAMDEWNYWHREYVYGELGCIYDWADGMGVAAGLHEFFRQSDIIHMAHYAQTVNVIGAIKTTRTAAEFETTGLVLKLYREHFGMTPVSLDGEFGVMDLVAALSEDGSMLTLGVVNPGSDSQMLRLEGVTVEGLVEGWAIQHPDPLAYNVPGEPRKIDILPMEKQRADDLYVDPYSVSVFLIPLTKAD